MDGRLKTLHPRVHGGLLGRRGTDDDVDARRTASTPSICWWSISIRSPPPSRGPTAAYAEAIENIDIGGPAMLRAAAKNHADVTVLVDPADYAGVLAEIDADRRHLDRHALAPGGQGVCAHRALRHADRATTCERAQDFADAATSRRSCRCISTSAQDLRYGENPHQRAAFYRDPRARGGASVSARGRCRARSCPTTTSPTPTPPSNACAQFAAPACVIVKHANPCGVAQSPPGCSRPIGAPTAPIPLPLSAASSPSIANSTRATARAILERQFAEVIAAPSVRRGALAVLAAKPNLRVLAPAL